jgi:hypothetical protein
LHDNKSTPVCDFDTPQFHGIGPTLLERLNMAYLTERDSNSLALAFTRQDKQAIWQDSSKCMFIFKMFCRATLELFED